MKGTYIFVIGMAIFALLAMYAFVAENWSDAGIYSVVLFYGSMLFLSLSIVER